MKINVKEEGFFSGYGIEKKDIFFILILILIAIFGFSFNANASVVIPPVGSALYNFWTSTEEDNPYLGATNVNTIFDTDFNYLGGWANNVYYNNNLYNPCLASDKRLGFGVGYYDSSGESMLGGISTSVKYTCVGDDFTFVHDPSDGYFSPTYRVNQNIALSPTYVLIYFNYGLYGRPFSAKALIYIDNQNNRYFLNDDFSEYSNVVGLPDCGSDDGLVLNSTPINLCNIGQADTPVFDGIKWDWSCSSGQVSEVCRAYSSTSNPINGSCGEWDGQDFDVWPDTNDLCDISSSLIFPSMLETINSYTWTCSGFNGGTNAYCSADKTTQSIFPELPAGSIDDCSSLGIPEVWFCNISNTIKSIFLPSADKITELNETINKISGRFPFSYINSSMSIISDISNNISEEDSLSLSIMGSESNTLYFEDIPFIHYIKIFTTILISFLFMFWLIRFIKDIF